MKNEGIVKAEILSVAKQLVQQYGLNKITMEDIAKKAGKGKSTLYYYFKNKNEIFNAVLKEESEMIFKQIKEAVETQEGKGIEEKLNTYLHTKLTIVESKIEQYKMLMEDDSHYFNFNNYFREMRVLMDQAEKGLIKSLLAEKLAASIQNKDRLIASADEDLVVEVFLVALRGLEMELFLNKEFRNLPQKAKLLTDMILNGV